MWLADLSPYGNSRRIVAVGWLARGHEYPRGDVPLDVFQTLRELLVHPWEPASSMGLHPCDLCLHDPEKHGSKNLFVPGEQCVYVAPELILHYVNAHGYRPPDVFCDAVRSCPAPRTAEYRRALLSAGGPGVLRAGYAGVAREDSPHRDEQLDPPPHRG